MELDLSYLLGEDEAAEKTGTLLRRKSVEGTVEDKLRKEQLVTSADLARDTAFEEHCRVLVDELELLEHVDALLVVGDELEVLVGDRQLEECDVGAEDLLTMQNLVLWSAAVRKVARVLRSEHT